MFFIYEFLNLCLSAKKLIDIRMSVGIERKKKIMEGLGPQWSFL